MDEQPQYIVILGDPVSGIEVIGPFTSRVRGDEWAEINHPNDTWWTTEMERP
jgi:hypothetical protein